MTAFLEKISFKKLMVGCAALFLVFVTLCMVCLSTGSVSAWWGSDDDDAEQLDYGFEGIASTWAEIFLFGHAPNFSDSDTISNDTLKEVAKLNVGPVLKQAMQSTMDKQDLGRAAGMLGYYNSDDGGFVGWLLSPFTNSSSSFDYQTMANLIGDGDSSAYYAYCTYGYMLSEMGIDDVGTGGIPFLRMFAGGSIFLAFIIAYSIPKIFGVMISLLQLINPFMLFTTSKAYVFDGATRSEMLVVGNWLNIPLGERNIFSGLAGWIAELYDMLGRLSWEVMIPITIVILLASVLLFNKTSKMAPGLKRLAIRILFLVIGVPLLGSLYTEALTDMANATADDDIAAVQVVGSTFVDFQSWVYNSRLDPPAAQDGLSAVTLGATVGTDTGEMSGKLALNSGTYMVLRHIAYRINNATGVISGSADSPFASGATSFDTNAVTDSTVDAFVSTDDDGNNKLGFSQAVNLAGMTNIQSMLFRYMFGDYVQPSSFESASQEHMLSGDGAPGDGSDLVKAWGSELKSVKTALGDDGKGRWLDYLGADNIDGHTYDANRGHLLSNGNLNVVFNGADYFSNSVGWNNPDLYTQPRFTFSSGGSPYAGAPNSGLYPTRTMGLSTLGMYNYLNTEFKSDSAVVYSVSKSSSIFTKPAHYQVNMIGNGLLSVLYWLNALVLLLCFAVIGIVYAMKMVINNLKRGVNLILEIPFAMLGVMRGIARVISYTLMMIIEVIATLFLYLLIMRIFMNVSAIVDTPIAKALGATITLPGVPMASEFGGYIIACVAMLLSTIFVIFFTVKALKMQSQFTKAIDDELARFVEKIVGVNAGDAAEKPKAPGMMNNLAQGMAQGAGMAMGANAVTNSQGNYETSGNGTSQVGQRQSVATGDGTEAKAMDADGDMSAGEGGYDSDSSPDVSGGSADASLDEARQPAALPAGVGASGQGGAAGHSGSGGSAGAPGADADIAGVGAQETADRAAGIRGVAAPSLADATAARSAAAGDSISSANDSNTSSSIADNQVSSHNTVEGANVVHADGSMPVVVAGTGDGGAGGRGGDAAQARDGEDGEDGKNAERTEAQHRDVRADTEAEGHSDSQNAGNQVLRTPVADHQVSAHETSSRAPMSEKQAAKAAQAQELRQSANRLKGVAAGEAGSTKPEAAHQANREQMAAREAAKDEEIADNRQTADRNVEASREQANRSRTATRAAKDKAKADKRMENFKKSHPQAVDPETGEVDTNQLTTGEKVQVAMVRKAQAVADKAVSVGRSAQDKAIDVGRGLQDRATDATRSVTDTGRGIGRTVKHGAESATIGVAAGVSGAAARAGAGFAGAVQEERARLAQKASGQRVDMPDAVNRRASRTAQRSVAAMSANDVADARSSSAASPRVSREKPQSRAVSGGGYMTLGGQRVVTDKVGQAVPAGSGSRMETVRNNQTTSSINRSSVSSQRVMTDRVRNTTHHDTVVSGSGNRVVAARSGGTAVVVPSGRSTVTVSGTEGSNTVVHDTGYARNTLRREMVRSAVLSNVAANVGGNGALSSFARGYFGGRAQGHMMNAMNEAAGGRATETPSGSAVMMAGGAGVTMQSMIQMQMMNRLQQSVGELQEGQAQLEASIRRRT